MDNGNLVHGLPCRNQKGAFCYPLTLRELGWSVFLCVCCFSIISTIYITFHIRTHPNRPMKSWCMGYPAGTKRGAFCYPSAAVFSPWSLLEQKCLLFFFSRGKSGVIHLFPLDFESSERKIGEPSKKMSPF